MGIFGAVSNFFGKIANDIVHTIAPGCNWQPSSLMKQVGALLPTIIEAIPTVGPLLSHAVPAISAIFGGSDKEEDVDKPKLPDQSAVIDMINKSLAAIADTRQTLSDKLESIVDKIEKDRLLADYGRFVQDIMPPIKYLKDSMEDLAAFVPFSANNRIENFVKAEREGSLDLAKYHSELKKAVMGMEQYLTLYLPTQDMLDLYILAVVWLLTYDKTVLTLRSYLAQHYLSINATTKYTSAINAWNEDFKDLRTHAKSCSSFILGDPTVPGEKPNPEKPRGLVQTILDKRQAAVGEVSDVYTKQSDETMAITGYNFNDAYPKYGIGYIGCGTDTNQSGLTTSINCRPEENDRASAKNALKGIRSGYVAINITYFQLATKAAVEAAEIWKDSLNRWQSRLPLTPSPKETTLVTSLGLVNSKKAFREHEDIGERKGDGWKTGETLTYAVSYVTSYGEGFLSTWSASVPVKAEDQYVKLNLAPVVFPKNSYEDESRFPKQINPGAVEVEIVRRVYVKVTFQDQSRIYIVGEGRGPSQDSIKLWDQAHGAHPTKVYDDSFATIASRIGVPTKEVPPSANLKVSSKSTLNAAASTYEDSPSVDEF